MSIRLRPSLLASCLWLLGVAHAGAEGQVVGWLVLPSPVRTAARALDLLEALRVPPEVVARAGRAAGRVPSGPLAFLVVRGLQGWSLAPLDERGVRDSPAPAGGAGIDRAESAEADFVLYLDVERLEPSLEAMGLLSRTWSSWRGGEHGGRSAPWVVWLDILARVSRDVRRIEVWGCLGSHGLGLAGRWGERKGTDDDVFEGAPLRCVAPPTPGSGWRGRGLGAQGPAGLVARWFPAPPGAFGDGLDPSARVAWTFDEEAGRPVMRPVEEGRGAGEADARTLFFSLPPPAAWVPAGRPRPLRLELRRFAGGRGELRGGLVVEEIASWLWPLASDS